MSAFLNLEAFNNFLVINFNDNLSKASKEMNISKSTLCLLKKGERDLGKKTLKALNTYCLNKKIPINELLFF